MTTPFVRSGGASLGASQVGMLLGLATAGITPDLIVGTSVGALNGGWVAMGPDVDGIGALADVWRSLSRSDVFPTHPIVGLLGFLGRRPHLVPDKGPRRHSRRLPPGEHRWARSDRRWCGQQHAAVACRGARRRPGLGAADWLRVRPAAVATRGAGDGAARRYAHHQPTPGRRHRSLRGSGRRAGHPTTVSDRHLTGGLFALRIADRALTPRDREVAAEAPSRHRPGGVARTPPALSATDARAN